MQQQQLIFDALSKDSFVLQYEVSISLMGVYSQWSLNVGGADFCILQDTKSKRVTKKASLNRVLKLNGKSNCSLI